MPKHYISTVLGKAAERVASEYRGGVRAPLAALAALLLVAGRGGEDDSSGGGGGGSGPEKVAVLLPDSKSSVRWETIDRPEFEKAFKAAGVPAEIQNAEGDKATQQQQAEQAITNGAKVLVFVNLDSGSGAAIAANAKSRGVEVVDYGRLTLKGDSDYYVSFDNVEVGRLQGEGLTTCLKDAGVAKPNVAVLNGSPTDNARRSSSRATTRSSTRSSSRASGTRSPTSRSRTGTTRRR